MVNLEKPMHFTKEQSEWIKQYVIIKKQEARAEVIEEIIKKLKIEFHPCLNCISYSTDECNGEDYFKSDCVTDKTISFQDIIKFAEQLKGE